MKNQNETVNSPEKKDKAHETLAVDLNQDIKDGKAKLFSVAEMWNLRKNFRSASDCRNWN